MPKFVVVNLDSGLAVDPLHPYGDTPAPRKTFATRERAEAFKLIMSTGATRAMPGHKHEGKYKVKEVKK